MAKFEFFAEDVKKVINDLHLYRSGWANDIREGWNCSIPGAKEIEYELYEISAVIILALDDRLAGRGWDKMAMFLTKDKLTRLVQSENFKKFDEMGQLHLCGVVTGGTKHHIRVMFECLEALTA
ncbi:MAG: hypothetical protein IJ770_00630 [Alphaproteobacteria bacterium]|nr:hypothetical protein [Alphaproteobacteria bacterium]